MKQYKVIGQSIRINAGTIVLSDEQADARLHCLTSLKNNTYDIVAPVCFKLNEAFGFYGDLPGYLVKQVEQTKEKPGRTRVGNVSNERQSAKEKAKRVREAKAKKEKEAEAPHQSHLVSQA